MYSFQNLIDLETLTLSKESQKNFPETIMVCLLNAMKLDSMEARQRFPRLLQLVEMYPDICSTFVEKVNAHPIDVRSHKKVKFFFQQMDVKVNFLNKGFSLQKQK